MERNLESALNFELGSFEGFNFREQAAIDRLLSAEEVLAWDHDANGEAEFWPSGEHEFAALLFKNQSSVTASEIRAVDALLTEIGSDSDDSFLRIIYAVQIHGCSIHTLTASYVEDLNLHIFSGGNFMDARREAAHELFELYYPEEYAVWEKSLCDGLFFDPDRFLDSPAFSTHEIRMSGQVFLIIEPQ